MRNFILSFLLVGCFFAETSAQKPVEKTLLWEITGNQISAPSYLYGTIHVLCPQDLVVSDRIKEKFGTAQQLYLEIDFDDPAMMLTMQKNMLMKDGSQLKKLLTPSEYATVADYFKAKMGMSLDMLGGVKPFMTMSMLIPSMMECQPASWEMSLVEMAKKQNAEVLGLETVEEQLAIFDKIPYAEQAQMLLKFVGDSEKNKTEMAQLIQAYKGQDLATLEKLIKESPDMANHADVLLKDRNEKWVPKIIKYSTERPTFFAVGAGHLGGETGVINLLRQAGYQVRAVF